MAGQVICFVRRVISAGGWRVGTGQLSQLWGRRGRVGMWRVEERVYMMWLSSQVTVLWDTNEWAQAGGEKLGFVGL